MTISSMLEGLFSERLISRRGFAQLSASAVAAVVLEKPSSPEYISPVIPTPLPTNISSDKIGAIKQLGAFAHFNAPLESDLSRGWDGPVKIMEEAQPKQLFYTYMTQRRVYESGYSDLGEVELMHNDYEPLKLHEAIEELEKSMAGIPPSQRRNFILEGIASDVKAGTKYGEVSQFWFNNRERKEALLGIFDLAEDPVEALKIAQRNHQKLGLERIDSVFNKLMDGYIAEGKLKFDHRKPEVMDKVFKRSKIVISSSDTIIPQVKDIFWKNPMPSHLDIFLLRHYSESRLDMEKRTQEVVKIIQDLFPPYCFAENNPHIHSPGRIRISPNHHNKEFSKVGEIWEMCRFFYSHCQKQDRTR